MSLKKEKILPSGVSGDYWKITRIDIDRMVLRITYVISLFKDEAHKNHVPMGLEKTFQFNATKEQIDSNVVALGYEKIKEYSALELPNINGVGVHFGDADLVGALDV